MSKRFGVIVGFGPLVSFEVAKKFVDEDFELLVIARSIDKISKLADKLGDAVHPMKGDGNDIEALLPKIREVVDDRGRLDLLHYHIGYGLNKLPLELTDQDLDTIAQLTMKSPLALIKEFAEDLEVNEGSFLVTGGGLALHPKDEFAAYSIGNAAKRNLVFTLYQQLQDKVHVGTVTINMTVDNHDLASRIADKYYELYDENKENWRPEIVYSE